MSANTPLMLIPELREIDAKLSIAIDPAHEASFQTALDAAMARLQTVDKTNLAEYAGTLQQVITMKQRLTLGQDRQALLAQKVAILENIFASMQ
jgi:hypothetical protein